MRLTSRSEYALLALVHLARHVDDGFLSVQTIAAAQDIPPRFLEQILLTLKRGRYVRLFLAGANEPPRFSGAAS